MWYGRMPGYGDEGDECSPVNTCSRQCDKILTSLPARCSPVNTWIGVDKWLVSLYNNDKKIGQRHNDARTKVANEPTGCSHATSG